MKFSIATVVIAATCVPTSTLAVSTKKKITPTAKNEPSLRGRNLEEWYYEDQYRQIFSDEMDWWACMAVENARASNGNTVTLNWCEGEYWQDYWRVDNDGMIHTYLDDDYCLQAGNNGSVEDGEKARLFECRDSEELQKFSYVDGTLRPDSNRDFCLVWQGQTPNWGDDIILKNCNDVQARNEWWTTAFGYEEGYGDESEDEGYYDEESEDEGYYYDYYYGYYYGDGGYRN